MRRWAWFASIATVAAAIAASGCAVPGVSAQGAAIPVWIDTDPAVGVADRDVDDGFALLQAFNSPELALRGVSVVFGNAPLVQAWPIGLRIVGGFGPRGVRAYRGAAKAADLGVDNAATRALTAALRREPLVILVLGPATNVATVLRNQPALRSRRHHPATPTGAELCEAESPACVRHGREQRDPLEVLLVDWRMPDVDMAAIRQPLRGADKEPIANIRAIEAPFETGLRPAVEAVEIVEYRMTRRAGHPRRDLSVARDRAFGQFVVRESPHRPVENHRPPEPVHVRGPDINGRRIEPGNSALRDTPTE